VVVIGSGFGGLRGQLTITAQQVYSRSRFDQLNQPNRSHAAARELTTRSMS
jgi:hypothetical protein